MQILVAKLEQLGERERERDWERFGHSGVSLRKDYEK
jgi:hypothetical protein